MPQLEAPTAPEPVREKYDSFLDSPFKWTAAVIGGLLFGLFLGAFLVLHLGLIRVAC